MAAITAVFTIARVAKMLGENEDWLHDLAIDVLAENGCLWSTAQMTQCWPLHSSKLKICKTSSTCTAPPEQPRRSHLRKSRAPAAITGWIRFTQSAAATSGEI